MVTRASASRQEAVPLASGGPSAGANLRGGPSRRVAEAAIRLQQPLSGVIARTTRRRLVDEWNAYELLGVIAVAVALGERDGRFIQWHRGRTRSGGAFSGIASAADIARISIPGAVH